MRIGLLLFALYIVVTLIQLQMDLNKSKQELLGIQNLTREQQLKNEDLKRLLNADNEQEHFERIARERFGFVRPDERVFIATNGN